MASRKILGLVLGLAFLFWLALIIYLNVVVVRRRDVVEPKIGLSGGDVLVSNHASTIPGPMPYLKNIRVFDVTGQVHLSVLNLALPSGVFVGVKVIRAGVRTASVQERPDYSCRPWIG